MSNSDLFANTSAKAMKKNIDHNSILAPNFTSHTDDELLQIYSSSSSDSISSESSDESGVTGTGEDETKKLKTMNDIDFKRIFRMNKSTVQELIDLFTADQVSNEENKNPDISYETQIYMTLSYLTSRESFKGTAKNYAVPMSIFWCIIYNTIQWIIRQPFIKWPSHQEQKISIDNFQTQTGIPSVIGALGVTHIYYKPAKVSEEQYRKYNKYSFVLQGVADHRNRFIDIHCGEPGGIDDYTVLRKSCLYKSLLSDSQAITPKGIIVGNETYPSSTWIVSPFRHHNRNARQQKFDKIITKPTKNIISAFATLKSRFQRFYTYIDRASICHRLQNLEFLIQSVVASCLLHNFCIERDDHVDTVDAMLIDGESDIGCYVIDQGSRRLEIFNYMQNKGII